MDTEILDNLVFLCKNLTNLSEVLTYLVQYNILSLGKEQEIMAKRTSFDQNRLLLNLIRKREWHEIRKTFLEILRATNNEHCANKIDANRNFASESSKKATNDSSISSTISETSQNSQIADGRALADEQAISLKHFESFEVINAGQFGLVMKATHKETKIIFAIKITKKYFYCEVDSLRMSSHPNIVKFMNSWMELSDEEIIDLHERFDAFSQMFCLQMELCKGSDLNSWIVKPPSKKSEWDAKRICYQIAVGVESFHSKKIIHRDLKPANILLLNKYAKGQEDLTVKIGDLGLSRATYQESKMSRRSLMTNCGTEFYMSPEQELKLERYNEKADIFPMAIIFYEVLNSSAFEKTQVTSSIRQAVIPRDFIDNFQIETKLLKEMLEHEPLRRPTAEQVVNELNATWNVEPRCSKMKNVNAATKDENVELKTSKPEAQAHKMERIAPTTRKSIENTKPTHDTEKPKVASELTRTNMVTVTGDETEFHKGINDKKLEMNNIPATEEVDEKTNFYTRKFKSVLGFFGNGEWQKCIDALSELFPKKQIIENEETTKCLTVLLEYWTRNEMRIALVDLNREATEMDVGALLICSYLRKAGNQEALRIAKQIVNDIGHLIQLLSITQVPNYHLQFGGHHDDTVILNLDVKTKKMILWNRFLSLNYFDGFSPEDLTLGYVTFLRNGQELEQVKVNDFLDLLNIKRLALRCSADNKNMSVDLSGDVFIEYLLLYRLTVFNWNKCNWSVKKLQLQYIPLVEKTNITIKQLSFYHSSLDVSCLPQTIRQIELNDSKVFVSGEVELPNLRYLTLEWVEDVGCLPHFRSAPLTHIHLFSIKTEVNVDHLPLTLSALKINKNIFNARVVGGVRKVDKLILGSFSFEEVVECLSHLQTDNLVIQDMRPLRLESLLLMSKKIKTIAVGEIKWEEGEFNNYLRQLDKPAESYLLQGGRGRAVEVEEFEELVKPF